MKLIILGAKRRSRTGRLAKDIDNGSEKFEYCEKVANKESKANGHRSLL